MTKLYSVFYKRNGKFIGPWNDWMYLSVEEAETMAKECRKANKAKTQIRQEVWKVVKP